LNFKPISEKSAEQIKAMKLLSKDEARRIAVNVVSYQNYCDAKLSTGD